MSDHKDNANRVIVEISEFLDDEINHRLCRFVGNPRRQEMHNAELQIRVLAVTDHCSLYSWKEWTTCVPVARAVYSALSYHGLEDISYIEFSGFMMEGEKQYAVFLLRDCSKDY